MTSLEKQKRDEELAGDLAEVLIDRTRYWYDTAALAANRAALVHSLYRFLQEHTDDE